MPGAWTGRGATGAGASLDSRGFMAALRVISPFLEGLALIDVHLRAERIAARAKSLAPVGSAEEEDPHPGAMRDDIGIKGEGIDHRGAYVDVGTRMPYGLYNEFGTSFMTAHPFMRPAIAAESGSGELATRVFLAPTATSTPFKRIRRARRSL